MTNNGCLSSDQNKYNETMAYGATVRGQCRVVALESLGLEVFVHKKRQLRPS